MTVWFYPNLQDTLALVIIIICRLISKVYIVHWSYGEVKCMRWICNRRHRQILTWSALRGKHFPCYLTSRGTRAGIFAYLIALLPVIDLTCCNVMPCEPQVLFHFKNKENISFVHLKFNFVLDIFVFKFRLFFLSFWNIHYTFRNKIMVGLRLRTVLSCIFGYAVKERLFLVFECSSTGFIFWSNALMISLYTLFKPPVFWLKSVSVCPYESHSES